MKLLRQIIDLRCRFLYLQKHSNSVVQMYMYKYKHIDPHEEDINITCINVCTYTDLEVVVT